jgi:hypothetical protein
MVAKKVAPKKAGKVAVGKPTKAGNGKKCTKK